MNRTKNLLSRWQGRMRNSLKSRTSTAFTPAKPSECSPDNRMTIWQMARVIARAESRCCYLIILLFVTTTTNCWGADSFDTFLQPYIVDHVRIRAIHIPETDIVVHEIVADPMSARAGLTLCWTELPSTAKLIGVKDLREYGASYEIYSRAVPGNAVAAINGGFFGYDSKGNHIPLGLVIADGKQKSPAIKWSTGGIILQKSDLTSEIVPMKKFASGGGIASALQAKPLLVEDGDVAIRGDDNARFNRTAIALTKSGRIVLAGAFESFGRALTLKEFAFLLAILRLLTGAEVQTALAMDGGPGSQLYFPGAKLHYGDPGNNYVPNFIYIRK